MLLGSIGSGERTSDLAKRPDPVNPADNTQPTPGMGMVPTGAAEEVHTSHAVALRSLRHHLTGALEALDQVLAMLPSPPRESAEADPRGRGEGSTR